MFRHSQKLFALVLISMASLAGAMPLALAQEAASAAVPPRAPAINVVSGQSRELVETLALTGTVVPRQEVAVGTDVVGLIVQELYVDQGDRVEKGEILARLDKSSLEVQIAQIEAQRMQAEASIAQSEAQIVDAEIAVRQASEELQRAKALTMRGVASKAQLDNAVNAFDSANAKLNTARQSLAATRSQLNLIAVQKRDVLLRIEKADVKAPADGLVLSRDALLGAVVSASAGPLFRIAREGEFELAADVPEMDLPRLKQGQKASVSLAGQAEPIEGTVRMISPEVTSASRLGIVKITLEANANVRPGNFGRAKVELARRSAVSVPLASIVYDQGQPALQVVKDGVVEARIVKLGIRDNALVEVLEGLEPGEEVVAKAGTFVASGDHVTPIHATDAPTGAIK
ncbi:MAG: efflux RND transporter periplasmic adaptor subunit [Phyllobacterium sp.]